MIRDTEDAFHATAAVMRDIPEADNQKGAVETMLRANGIFRNFTRIFRFGRASLSWTA